MSRRLQAPAILLATGALALGALAGCGDDDEDVQVTVPEISVEDPDLEVAPPPETTDPQTGGTGSPEADPTQEDSETNDKPPEPGSPEEAFEQACEQNPAACG